MVCGNALGCFEFPSNLKLHGYRGSRPETLAAYGAMSHKSLA